MSLTDGFLDELRTRASIVQVVGRKVMWDARKSNQGKGDMWAPCPFHHEKTASFHVDDRKGFYYCFGCQAKGDALKFIRETENVSFMEAVEILAGEVGMEMPKRDPRAQEKADERTELAEVMEQAHQFYRLQLRTGGAVQARTYLERRGLQTAAQDRFEIGFAPAGWQNLWDHLKAKNVSDDKIMAAGLAKPSSKGGKPYDVFRDRIMFPIRDPRGRVIAFGGRAMDPNDNAKYLNSPETLLFDKGRSLYNHGPAREAAGKGQTLVVAEGYMDVIALAEGGFAASVAPLGTAITDAQLQLMWRIADEPIIALDGDKAGLRAAFRLIDLALPLLQAGKSLRFALMPEGQDPDDLIRAKGSAAVQKVLDEAKPMVELLWQSETEGRVFDSPERKAALDKSLRERIKRIEDPSIRQHYGQAIKDMRWSLFSGRTTRGAGGNGGWQARARGPMVLSSTKSSALAHSDAAGQRLMREAVILAALIETPQALEPVEGTLEELRFVDPTHQRLCNVLLSHGYRGRDGLRVKIAEICGHEALERLHGTGHVAITPCVRRPGNLDLTSMTVAEELAKLDAETGLAAEIEDAAEDISDLADETLTWRLGQAAEAKDRAMRAQQEDKTEYDTGPNGARINRDERDAFAALLHRIGHEKPS